MAGMDEHEHEWVEVELDCETCGVASHEGLLCKVCLETVDFVWTRDPR